MAQLNPHRGIAECLAKLDHAFQTGFLGICAKAQTARRNPASHFYAHRFGDNQANARDRILPQVHQMPIRRDPLISTILAHGCHDDPVAQLNAGQSDG